MNGKASEHFNWEEFYCPMSNMVKVNDLTLDHIDKLERLRLAFGRPLRVNSGYRCPQHNASVGGADRSMHLEFASDLTPVGQGVDLITDLAVLHRLATEINFTGIGRYNNFIHLDCRNFIGRPFAEWDKRT